jgi:hypothetical protein
VESWTELMVFWVALFCYGHLFLRGDCEEGCADKSGSFGSDVTDSEEF